MLLRLSYRAVGYHKLIDGGAQHAVGLKSYRLWRKFEIFILYTCHIHTTPSYEPDFHWDEKEKEKLKFGGFVKCHFYKFTHSQLFFKITMVSSQFAGVPKAKLFQEATFCIIILTYLK